MESAAVENQYIPIDKTTTLSMLKDDPASVYRRLRKENPVVRIAALGRIAFTKAEDVQRIKTDAEHFGCYNTTTPMERAFRGHTLMRKDGPEHHRERHAMADTFTGEAIESHWHPRFAKVTDDLLETLPRNEGFDLYTTFAAPLAARYVRLVIGLDTATDMHLLKWAPTLIKGAMNQQFDEAVFALCDTTNDEIDACIDDMIEKYQASPNGSVLSTMVNAQNPLTSSQMKTNMRVCIAGGLVETRDALLSTLYGLLINPEQKQHCLVTGDWGGACEEGLRWMAPIQANTRTVLKTTVIGGFRIPEGETVLAIQASANHDEDIWEKPQLFDVRRKVVPNHTFGAGAHKCPGADIYRTLVADSVLPKLFERFPEMALQDQKQVVFSGFAFRGPTALWVHTICP